MQRTDDRFAGLLEAATRLQPKTVALRRKLHRHPELGLRLPESQAAIRRALEGLPLEITLGTGTSSVTAVLRGSRPGPAVLLRGDMDALPLTEETGEEFSSEVEGAMHACGHDAHVAMLASAARLLADRASELAGSVVFMFQPGEEGYHGAKHLIEDGVLEAAGERVRSAFGLHIAPGTPSGAIATRPGPLMASTDRFVARVTGKGGHGSMPHDAVDPVPAAAAMVGALQTMITRRVDVMDPAVLTVGRIIAGTRENIIPETAVLEGTIRTLSERTRELVPAETRVVCENVAAAYGCRVDFEHEPQYPVTVNDAESAKRVLKIASSVLGPEHALPMPSPMMGSEDFSYVLREVPGAFAFLGACPPHLSTEEAAPNHSNRVHYDEAAFPRGVAMHAAFALDALGAD